MFEQEVELEKQQSGALPLLLMVALVVALVGVAVYYLAQSRQVLTKPEATTVLTNILAKQAAPTVSFHVGQVTPSYGENPTDARYKLLAKAGILNIGKAKGDKTPVTLTAKGSELLKQIAGVKQSKDSDGTDFYIVPLASRKLVEISKITMAGPDRATIQYSWSWEPNTLGESFDASGATLASFNNWDRVALIDKFGARYYHEAPTKVAIVLAREEKGWRVTYD